jgi:hypothetical protein
MTHSAYLVWLVATGVATVAILVVSTLAAADIIHFGRQGAPQPTEEVDVWGQDSFPASDPPQNW